MARQNRAFCLGHRKTEKASGPLWIGPLCDSDIASRLTEEKAEQICGLDLQEMPTDWDQQRLNLVLREIRRSVRHIADAAPLLSQDHLLIPMDVFAKKSGRWTSEYQKINCYFYKQMDLAKLMRALS